MFRRSLREGRSPTKGYRVGDFCDTIIIQLRYHVIVPNHLTTTEQPAMSTPTTKFAIFETLNGTPVWVATHDTMEQAQREQAERIAEGQVDTEECSFILPVTDFFQNI
jgi:hypothetical protein